MYIYKLFIFKAPYRKQKVKLMKPNVPLPPKPITTRWGTWLEAAEYYCNYLEDIREVIEEFNEKDSEALRQCKELISNEKLKHDLSFIKTNFKCILHAITKLESRGLPLNNSLETIESIQLALQKLTDKNYFKKMEAVFARNPGFVEIIKIKDIIFNNSKITSAFIGKLSSVELTMFKYAPVSSCDVERVFSIYGNFLTNQRRSFTLENLKMHLVVNCNRDIEQGMISL